MPRNPRQKALALSAAWLVAFFAFSPAFGAGATQRDKDLAEIGDWVQILLPVSGYVGTWITGDKEGAFQLTKALSGAGISAHTFKFLAERGRPDASDKRSFPSGHTTAAFAGSEFIRVRWGNAWGIPATLAAAFVGYSRIRVNKHFRDDVLAGASNGLMWNWYATSPVGQTLNVRPAKLDGGYGFEFSYAFDGEQPVMNEDYRSRPRFSYNLEWGPVTQDTNLFAAPNDTGTVLDLATAEDEFDFTSRVTFEHYFADRHEWAAYLAPMELIEFDPATVITEPVEFGGRTFLPNDEAQFESRYNFIELRAVYRYRLVESARWSVRVGGGLQYHESFLGITQFLGSPRDNNIIEAAEASLEQIKAIASTRVSYRFGPRWRLDVQADGYPGSDKYINAGVLLNWRAAPAWEFGFGARYIDREVTDGGVYNKLQAGDIVLSVTHGFF